MSTLDQLPIGKTAQILGVEGEAGDSITRLMEMGMVEGTEVKVERTSLFGCPIAIRLKGTSIAIRRSDAKSVMIALQPQFA